MANYQKKEEKKQRREAMMAKYPPRNSRENVSAVLTRKEQPVKATPLGVAKPNSEKNWENAILLTEAGKNEPEHSRAGKTVS